MADSNKPLDLKNIDAGDFIKELMKQKITVMKIVIFVVSAVLIGGLVSNFFKVKTNSQNEMAMLQEKLAVIERYKESKDKFNTFLTSLPKNIEENNLVNVLSDFAVQNNVEVLSFSGVRSQSFAYYDVYTVEMNIRVDSFKAAVVLIKAIEGSSSALRLDSFSISGIESGSMSIKLMISTIRTKS